MNANPYFGLKKEGDLISEANSQLTRSQTKNNGDTKSRKSNDRYGKISNISNRAKLASNKDSQSNVGKSISQAKKSEIGSISDFLSQTQKANALGETMQGNLLVETGKLGMQFVAHDLLVDNNNIQKALIHHGANSQSLYQYYHRNKGKVKSTNKIQTPIVRTKAIHNEPQSQLIKSLVGRKTLAHPNFY